MCDANGKCGSCSGTASVPGSGKILTYNIRLKGFGILYSFTELPSFSYTAGIQESWSQPELIVFGLDYDRSTLLLTGAVDLIKKGAILTEHEGNYRICDTDVRFLEVPARVAARLLNETASYYGEKKFRVLQMLWPDEQGRFPSDPQCQEQVRRAQPVIADT